MPKLTEIDQQAIESFSNFLSWGVLPSTKETPKNWPPAVWAYVWGLTFYCPHRGTL